MRSAHSFKSLLIVLIMLTGLCVTFGQGQAQENQPSVTYRYGYIPDESNGSNSHLYLINPKDGSQTESATVLPVESDEFVLRIIASPDGQWLGIVVGSREGLETLGVELRLLNVLTGEVRKLFFRMSLHEIVWSSNSRYLAVNATDAEIGVGVETYVYDVQTDTLQYISDDGYYRGGLSWSPDGTRLAVIRDKCSDDSCQTLIDLVAFPNYTVLRSTPFESFGDPLCDFAWSPDNRYFSFVYSCGLTPYISDVFTLDTATGSIRQVTTFTQELSVFLQFNEPSTSFSISYDLTWYDADHLLIGMAGGAFRDGVGYDTDTVQVKTFMYHPDGVSTQVSSAMFSSWTHNPANDVIAFRSEQKVLYTDEYNMPQLTNQSASVQVAKLDGDTFQVLHTLPINGCDLSWSPDGVYLAYSQSSSDVTYCGSGFFNQVTEQTTSYYPVSANLAWLGWVATTENS